MKTRLRFKIIAVLICLSLVGLLISQGYWLKGLYVSSKKSEAGAPIGVSASLFRVIFDFHKMR